MRVSPCRKFMDNQILIEYIEYLLIAQTEDLYSLAFEYACNEAWELLALDYDLERDLFSIGECQSPKINIEWNGNDSARYYELDYGNKHNSIFVTGECFGCIHGKKE